MNRPPNWPIVVGVYVDAQVATTLVALLADGRRRVQRDGWRLPEDVNATLAALDRLAATVKDVPASPPEPVWMSTAEAAEALRVSETRVRQLCREGKLAGRKALGGVWRVDATDVWFRAEEVGTPSASAIESFCA